MSQRAITALELSVTQAEEQKLLNQGFSKNKENLNQDKHPVNIWYKKQADVDPITRIQISYNDEMSVGLAEAGYQKVNINLISGCPIYLWYFRGQTEYDTAIEELEVSTSAEDDALKMELGLERVGYNLSGSQSWLRLWMKRVKQTYICDIEVTNSYDSDADLFRNGYIRIDDSPNKMWLERMTSNFLWYRQTTDQKMALTNLQISKTFSQPGYKRVELPLNDEMGRNGVYVWYKKREPPVHILLVLSEKHDSLIFQEKGATIIEQEPQSYWCYFTME